MERNDIKGLIPEAVIAARAYALWVERGCREGDGRQDWFDAAAQLQSEQALRAALGQNSH